MIQHHAERDEYGGGYSYVTHIFAYPLGHLKHFYAQMSKTVRLLSRFLPVGLHGILVPKMVVEDNAALNFL